MLTTKRPPTSIDSLETNMKNLWLALILSGCFLTPSLGQDIPFERGDHVVYIGNTLADRMQHHAWLETYVHALLPDYELTFRNLGFSGDEVKLRQRADNFGDADQWLTKCEADVIACFFGYNEALKGEAGLTKFSDDFAEMLDHMKEQKYNGESAPSILVFSPIAHEDLRVPHLPDGSANNKNLAMYTAAMAKICEIKNVPFVDLFSLTQQLYKDADKPLTMNGIHLLDHGNKALAQAIVSQFAEGESLPSDSAIAKLRELVLDKNYHWFSRYRVVDEYNVFGGRSKLNWFGQSNADVMMKEMEIFDVKTKNRDKAIWAVAQGQNPTVHDDNLPKEEVVKRNKIGPLENGDWPYLGGDEAIEKMTVNDGMEINLFASEEQFPRLINPVQVAVDTDSRLWCSVWPSYPHWNPTQPRKDAIVILPDEDNDGKADELIVFADELNSITGFEFWGGGVLVAAPPEIWFLKDSDGDDKADVKIRMLQGVSSADTHHSANAVVISPDGWMNWSRGIFNVAAFETPTQTYRSGRSGVHRFNPRTFEVDFHYPIGPNPHGDVIDRWGYQFANDGTSGTGGYVSIGKGMRPGNKQWFKKEWRPVAATGILSSSMFPEKNQHNFMICNTIGFLGVLQYEVKYDGAGITAVRTDDIVRSTDPNFRPSDIEIGGDGAIYIADWHNALIGHMQHNMRDPNRDATHGRIYRIAAKGGTPLKPVKMKGKPIAEVLSNFFAKENSVRYRTRLELSGRETKDVVAALKQFTGGLNPGNDDVNHDEAQALLECLWVLEEHRVPNIDLVKKTFASKEARVRSGAIRTLGHWAGKVEGWEETLVSAARDDSALVRAEAVKAAVEFTGLTAAEVIFEVATRGTDPELNDVLAYGKSNINVDAVVQDTIDSGRKLSAAAQSYVLQNASVADLVKLDPTEGVYNAILGRKEATTTQLSNALNGLVKMSGGDKLDTLLKLIDEAQQGDGNVAGLGKVLAAQPSDQLARIRKQIEDMAVNGKTSAVKQLAYAAWVAAAGPDDAFLAASKAKASLRDFLDAVPAVSDSAREQLYDKVEPLISNLPTQLQAEAGGSGLLQRGITVEYFDSFPGPVTQENLDKLTPSEVGVVPDVSMDVPQRKKDAAFALRFSGMLNVTQQGRYEFRVESDDGSRVYLDGKEIINNDGAHGMTEKRSRRLRLKPGPHSYVLNYTNKSGSKGLSSGWKGPGFDWQKIPTANLTVSGGETLHDVAIRALASIPGNDSRKFSALSSLIAKGKNRPAAISAISGIDSGSWPTKEIGPLVDNLIGYLSEMPARYRTGGAATDAIALVKSLSTKLSPQMAKSVEARLQNLDVRVIAIGTVPTRMIYDKEMIVVQAGKPVEFRFSNTDHMPHNFAVTVPGALQEVGELAEATGRDADAVARHYIPKSDKVLVGSKLLQPGQTQAISFEVPTAPGVYPYVCTYPGHWRRMFGALYVVEDLEQYQLNPTAYLAANKLPIKDELLTLSTRGREWSYDDLIASMQPKLPMGRSHEVGKELFKVASCTGCHKLEDVGRVFGPDLATLDEKKHTVEHILRSILEPSKEIDAKYQSYTFLLDDGRTITGMITEENAKVVKVVIDPLAKDSATTIPKDSIEERVKSDVSMMPKGLLDRLSREEILDLIAYVYTKGDPKNMLFQDHSAHNH